jgi:cobalt/nickel transport system ATP-binding protein
MSCLIKIKGLSYSYKTIDALDGINLSIHEGDCVAVIGPNGSGKSTLLKIMNGLIFPVKGEYFFRHMLITEEKLKDPVFSRSFHKAIGFVFQNSDTQLFCPSVYEEIAFGPTQMNFSSDERSSRVNDCMKLLSIEHLKDRAPYNLSEGEKKKVAIASVLALNPEILVLDEPLNGLDPKTKGFLKGFMSEINKAGKAIICATHDFEHIGGIFNKVLVLSEDNKAVFWGYYENIINDQKLLIQNNLK